MKLIVLTFGGRESSIKILFNYILKYKKYINEFRIYIATTIQSDIDFMENFAKINSDFVKTVYCIIDNKIILNDKCLIWDNAYKSCCDKNTVYIKLDDDIVYVDENLFTKFVDFRINNFVAPLIFPVIINNLVISNILQDKQIFNSNIKTNIYHSWKKTYNNIYNYIIDNKYKKIRIGDIVNDNDILCPISWGNINYCINLHNQFISDLYENKIDKYYFNENIELKNAEPVSNNVCS